MGYRIGLLPETSCYHSFLFDFEFSISQATSSDSTSDFTAEYWEYTSGSSALSGSTFKKSSSVTCNAPSDSDLTDDGTTLSEETQYQTSSDGGDSSDPCGYYTVFTWEGTTDNVWFTMLMNDANALLLPSLFFLLVTIL